MKETIILEYLSKINFKGNFNVNDIKNELRQLLGETPALDIKWGKEPFINEDTNKSDVRELVEEVKVVYLDLDNKFKTISFLTK